MPATDQFPITPPLEATPEVAPAVLPSPRIAKLGATMLSETVTAFYGADSHFLGRPLGENTVRSIVTRDGKNEVIAETADAETIVGVTLDAMRTLETVKTKAIVHMPMSETQSVLFSNLEHYTPKIAPGSPTYPVPDFVRGRIEDGQDRFGKHDGRLTLKHTLETPGWDGQLVGLMGEFLKTKDEGILLAKNLKITSLETLTPEQAVKLSVALVQSASKYSWDSAGAADGERADQSTAMELLREGLDRKDDPTWQGNGVCRNIASNVSAVFEALKLHQTDLSMLNNTYVTMDVGDENAYKNSREDDASNGTTKLNTGHAWNSFITVDGTGSANMTTIDATWALDRNVETALNHMDYTAIRMASMVRELAGKSERGEDALAALSDYYNVLIRKTATEHGFSSPQYAQAQEFAFTQLTSLLGERPELIDPQLSGIISGQLEGVPYRLQDRLSDREIVTLHQMSKAGWIDNFDVVLERYVKADTVITRRDFQKIERLIQPDNELQGAILSKIGQEKAVAMSEANGRFRIRLREMHPEWLPKFDAIANPADGAELMQMAGSIGINSEKDPARINKQVRKRLLDAAGDPAIFEAIVAGRSDYDLLKSFRAIQIALRKPK